MNCPKCSANMKVLHYHGYEVDRCAACHGLWFDRLECDELRLLDNPEILDIGDPTIGKKFNRKNSIDCPRCKRPMVKIEAEGRTDVWYEGCLNCRGVFFDAGEFRDYLDSDIVISFKKLSQKFGK